MAYPHKWSPISYKSSAGQWKHTGQRPMLYRWTTPPTGVGLGIRTKLSLKCTFWLWNQYIIECGQWCPTWWPPSEYRWRPLFNAAKFGWCPLLKWGRTKIRRHRGTDFIGCRRAEAELAQALVPCETGAM